MAGAGDMWQDVGAYGRGWWHVVGSGSMWQGWVHVTKAMGIWQGEGCGHVAGVGASGRGWICENMTNVKKSKMLTMNEVHKNFNLTQ